MLLPLLASLAPGMPPLFLLLPSPCLPVLSPAPSFDSLSLPQCLLGAPCSLLLPLPPPASISLFLALLSLRWAGCSGCLGDAPSEADEDHDVLHPQVCEEEWVQRQARAACVHGGAREDMSLGALEGEG